MNDESPMQDVSSQIREIVNLIAALSKVRSRKSGGQYGCRNGLLEREMSR